MVVWTLRVLPGDFGCAVLQCMLPCKHSANLKTQTSNRTVKTTHVLLNQSYRPRVRLMERPQSNLQRPREILPTDTLRPSTPSPSQGETWHSHCPDLN